MKKILATILLVAAALVPRHAHAAIYTLKSVQMSTNPVAGIQPGTTGYWMWVDSGTFNNLNFIAGKSTSTFSVIGATWTFTAAVISGTRNDNSTTTVIGAGINGTKTDASTTTYTGGSNFRNGISISTGATQTAMFNVSPTSVTIKGVTDGSVAGVGNYNQVISSYVIVNATCALSAYFDAAKLVVPPGHWFLYGGANFKTNSASVTALDVELAITTTPGNTAGFDAGITGSVFFTNAASGLAAQYTLSIPIPVEVTVTTNTNYYLKGYFNATGGPPVYTGGIWAVRAAH